MRAWLSLALPTALALQAFAFGWDPARAATKVSFGQVSATATMWPGVVATKKGFFAANGVEMDTVSLEEQLRSHVQVPITRSAKVLHTDVAPTIRRR